MQVNHSNALPLSNVQQNERHTQVSHSREQARVNEQQNVQQQVDTNKNNKEQAQQTRFDVDQQALVQVEQYNQAQNASSTNNANTNQSTSSTTRDYDQPSQQHQSAINRYQSVETLAQRDSIKQTFGVDLYA